MEIQYNKFNEFIKISEGLSEFCPIVILGKEEFEQYISEGIKTEYSKEETRKVLIAHTKLMIFSLETLSLDVIHEINFNIASIPTLEQLERYLQTLLSRSMFMCDDVKFELCYDLLVKSQINFNATRDRNESDPNYEELGIILSGRPLSESESSVNNDIASIYLTTCYNVCFVYNQLFDYIQSKLEFGKSGKSQSLIMDNELSAVNHRLILLHRLGVFQPLYNDHYNTIGPGSFTKLIANIIGVPNDSIDGFRAEVRKLIKEMSNPNSKKVLQTEAANRKVNLMLTEIGLNNVI